MAKAQYLRWDLPIESKKILIEQEHFYFLGFDHLGYEDTRRSQTTKIFLSLRNGKTTSKNFQFRCYTLRQILDDIEIALQITAR